MLVQTLIPLFLSTLPAVQAIPQTKYPRALECNDTKACPYPTVCTDDPYITWCDASGPDPVCPGTCSYQSCGGMDPSANKCPDGTICSSDPRTGGCGLACDQLGICIPVDAETCGGFVGALCGDPDQECYDNPADDCDPETGGADCIGVCLFPLVGTEDVPGPEPTLGEGPEPTLGEEPCDEYDGE